MSRLLFVAALALAGCGGISVRYRGRTPLAHPPLEPSAVAIYTLTPVGLRYEVVGTLRAEASGLDLEPGPALLARIRDAAAANGCGAVLIDHGYCVEEGGRSQMVTSNASLEAACIEVQR